MMRYTPEQIWYADGGIFTLDNDDLRRIVSKLFPRIPEDVVNSVMSECLMLVVTGEDKGTYLSKRMLEGKALIAFPEDLFGRSQDEIERTVLHEVAHFILDHRSPALELDVDYDLQEREADELAERWLANHPREAIR